MKRQIRKIVNQLLARTGFSLVRTPPVLRGVRDMLFNMLSAKGEVRVMDIGAAQGEFTRLVLDLVPGAEVLCVEPILANVSVLRRRFAGEKVKVVQAVAGKVDGVIDFHESRDRDCSSVLEIDPENRDFGGLVDQVRTYQVSMASVATLLRQVAWERVDVLKVDTQGFELAVLEGCGEKLGLCRQVLLEVSLRPVYQDQPLFQDIAVFMDKAGFDMVDCVEGARSRVSGELVQLDVMFGRRAEQLSSPMVSGDVARAEN